MTSQANTDLVPVIAPFIGDNSEAIDMAGIICEFTGFMCGNAAYMQYRVYVLTLVFRAQAAGCSEVTICRGELPYIRVFEQFLDWVTTDLSFLGYHVDRIGYKKTGTLRICWERRTWAGTFWVPPIEEDEPSENEETDDELAADYF